MAVLPTKPTVPPTNLAGQSNGNLDPALLVSIGPGTARLHHTVARGWRALVAAAFEAGGWVLWWTSGADTYRSYSVQLWAFLDRYQPVTNVVWIATPGERRKRWPEAPALGYASEWWIKKNIGTVVKPRYPSTAAVPGTSPHGWGCAIDGAFPGPVAWSPALPWLIGHAHLYGFAWSLQSEPWHIQWVMGDVIPQAVLDFEKPPPEEDDVSKPINVIKPAPGWMPSYDNNNGPATFIRYGSGIVQRAVANDEAVAIDLGAAVATHSSKDWYNELLRSSGSTLPVM